MSGSYYERPYLPPEPVRPVRLGPIIGAVVIAEILASGVSAFIVAWTTPSGRLAPYLIAAIVFTAGGALLLPGLLRELAGVRITGETAVFALLAGAVTTFALRFVVAEVFLHGSSKYSMPTPRSLGAGLVLTWCAAFVGAWVAASLIRERAKPLAPGYRSRVGGVIGTRFLFVIAVGALFFVVINVTDRRITSEVRSTAKNATAGLSVLLYSQQLETTQRLVFDSYRVVTTAEPRSTSILLRANIDGLRGRLRSLSEMSPPGEGTDPAHRNFLVGLDSFIIGLPRVGAYRTSRAQQRAFLRTPGLRTMQTALMELDAALLRAGLPGRGVYEPRRWAAMLRGVRT